MQAAAGERRRPRTTIAPGWALMLGGLLMVVAALMLLKGYGLFANVDHLSDLGKISNYTPYSFATYLVSTSLLFAGYIIAVVSRINRPLRDQLIALGILSLALLLAFALIYPATAIDLYLYAVRSRLFTEYGLNPSAARPIYHLEDDPYMQFTTWQWAGQVSPYGPLWNWIAAPGTLLAGEKILPAIMYFKVVSIAATIATACLLHAIARTIDRRYATAAVILWLWNPLLLWEGIANVHNDVIAVLPLIAALWCWQTRRDHLVLPALITSVLIKYTALPLLPVMAVAIYRRAPSRDERVRTLTSTILLSAGATLISLAPFYDLQALRSAFEAQRGVFVTSLPQIILRSSNQYDWNLNREIVSNASALIVAITMLIACYQVWRAPDRLINATYTVMFVLLLVGISNMRPWYVIWLIPLAIVAGINGPWVGTIVWSLTALLSYAHYIWLRDWWAPSRYWFEITGVSLMIVPVIAAMIVEWRDRRAVVT